MGDYHDDIDKFLLRDLPRAMAKQGMMEDARRQGYDEGLKAVRSHPASTYVDNGSAGSSGSVFPIILIMTPLCLLGLLIGWKLISFDGDGRQFTSLLGLGILLISGLGLFGQSISFLFIGSVVTEKNSLTELVKRVITPMILLGLLLGVVWFFGYQSNLHGDYIGAQGYEQMISQARVAAWKILWGWFWWLLAGTLTLLICNLVSFLKS